MPPVSGISAQDGAATSGGLPFTYGGIIVIGPALFGALTHAAGFGAAVRRWRSAH